MAETTITLSNNAWVAVDSGAKAGWLQNRALGSSMRYTVITTASGGPTTQVGHNLKPGEIAEVFIPSGQSLYARGVDLQPGLTHQAVLLHRTVT